MQAGGGRLGSFPLLLWDLGYDIGRTHLALFPYASTWGPCAATVGDARCPSCALLVPLPYALPLPSLCLPCALLLPTLCPPCALLVPFPCAHPVPLPCALPVPLPCVPSLFPPCALPSHLPGGPLAAVKTQVSGYQRQQLFPGCVTGHFRSIQAPSKAPVSP